MGRRKLTGLFLGLVLAAAMLLTACGEETSISTLEDGLAEGPGFSFELGEDWAGADDAEGLKDLAEEGFEEELPGIDIDGLLFAGFWIQPESDEKLRVNVVVEPITADTSTALITDQTEFSLSELAAGEIERRELEFETESAPTLVYTREAEDLRTWSILLRRDDLNYIVTVQGEGEADGAIEPLAEQIAETWRYREPSPAEQAELDSPRMFEGDGYAVTVPPGWRPTGKEALGADPTALGPNSEFVDSVWRGQISPTFATNVNVIASDVVPSYTVDDAARDVLRDERANLGGAAGASGLESSFAKDLQVDGEPARDLRLSFESDGLEVMVSEVIVVHDGTAFTIALTSTPDRFDEDRQAFAAALKSWRWK